ncbi:MAG: histidine kinase [Gammaproteobacteria bacterium]|nr:histidine kinase [Gammaproteobacteria bacterium]
MATELERIASLETHYEHVARTLTAIGLTLEAIRAEIGELRTELRTEMADVRESLRTEIEGVRQMVHSEIGRVRTDLGGRLDDIVLRMAEDKAAGSETKLRVALKVIGWLVGVVTTVLGTVIGGLFLFARYLLPKLASALQDAAPAIT